MADLGNSKIKDTYQLVLQADASGNLQKLDGSSPSLTINSAFTYNVGTLVDGYVLKSNGSGVASWGALNADIYLSAATLNGTTLELDTTSGNTLSVDLSSLSGDSYWSANTDGTISPSGLTTNVGIGTSTPNKPLTVVGDVSGTTDLYLGDSVHTASTITAEESLTLKGRGADNDYMVLQQDAIDFHIDGLQVARVLPGVFDFNSSGYDYDFKINGEDQLIFRVYGTSGEERVRIKDHLAIGGNETISHADSVDWGLAVTGSSLFYSGGTNGTNRNAISAVGDISGTTDLHIDDNIQGLRGQFGNLPAAGGATRDLDIKGDSSVYLRLQSTTNANQTIEFMNDQEPDFLIYNKHTDGGLHIASDDKPFFIIGANDGDTIDLYGNTTISGNTVVKGKISGTTNLYIDAKIYSGTTNLLDIFASSAITNQDVYWSANTDGSISPSGLTTYVGIGTATPDKTFHIKTDENTVAVFESTDATVALKISDSTDDAYIVGKNNMLYISDASGSPSSNAEFAFDYVNGKLGIKTTTPNVPLTVVGDISGTTNLYIDGDINGNRKFEPSSIDVGNKQGDIVYFPVEPPASTTAGSIYYYDGSTWLSTDASAVATSSGLTAVAVGTDSSEGMLIRGMVTLAASTGGVDGNVIYLSEAAGKAVTSPPASASAVVRTMGYVLDTSEKRIWFNPDNTWVELSS